MPSPRHAAISRCLRRIGQRQPGRHAISAGTGLDWIAVLQRARRRRDRGITIFHIAGLRGIRSQDGRGVSEQLARRCSARAELEDHAGRQQGCQAASKCLSYVPDAITHTPSSTGGHRFSRRLNAGRQPLGRRRSQRSPVPSTHTAVAHRSVNRRSSTRSLCQAPAATHDDVARARRRSRSRAERRPRGRGVARTPVRSQLRRRRCRAHTPPTPPPRTRFDTSLRGNRDARSIASDLPEPHKCCSRSESEAERHRRRLITRRPRRSDRAPRRPRCRTRGRAACRG